MPKARKLSQRNKVFFFLLFIEGLAVTVLYTLRGFFLHTPLLEEECRKQFFSYIFYKPKLF